MVVLLSRSVFGKPREKFPLEEWVEQYEEDAFEPEITIFDAHHHLFDPRTQPKGWPVSPAMIKMIYTLKPHYGNKIVTCDATMRNTFGARCPAVVPYMAREMLRDIQGNGKGHQVVGSIYVESGWKAPGADPVWASAGEVDMAIEEHQKYPLLCQGIIGNVDLRLGAAIEPVLHKYAKNPLVKGVNYSLAWTDDKTFVGSPGATKGLAYDATFREGFALLSKYKFSFETWCYSPQVDDLVDLAQSFPKTTIIVSHIGMPLGLGKYEVSEVVPKWKDSMTALARNPNVFVKIGGMGMRPFGFGFDEWVRPPTSDALAEAFSPYVLFVIETFGIDRCMMESNFPMDKISCSYTVLFNGLKKIVRKFSQEDKQKLFELNAKRIYRVPLFPDGEADISL